MKDLHEFAQMRTIQRNKASNFLGAVTNEDLLSWADIQKYTGGFYTTEDVVTNIPASGTFVGLLTLTGVEKFLVLVDSNGTVYTNRTVSGVWNGYQSMVSNAYITELLSRAY